MNNINKVAVFGSGTMGLGIAAVCANAGCEVLLLDLEKSSCDQALPKLLAGRNPVVQDPSVLDRISTGSFDQDMERIAQCQWICEAVVENANIKREIFSRAEQFRSDNSIISTNTSGIPLKEIYTGMAERLQRDIAVTHFFNPVHIMQLVELVPGTHTRAEVIDTLADFLGNTLNKGVVYAKDTVNFIGNRIGCMWINAGLHFGEKAIKQQGLTIETVDALLAEPIGLPATGLYALADLIGIDVMYNVNRNLQQNLPQNDYSRRFIKLPPSVQSMYDEGQVGRKSGGGFYKLSRHDDGSKTMEVFDLASESWNPERPYELKDTEKDFKSLFSLDTANGQFVQQLMASALCYTADLVPEIADDIVNVDRAMRWGFAWQKGPFELIDELGAQQLINWATENQYPALNALPNMLQVLSDSGETSFYRNQGSEFLSVSGKWQPVPGND